MLAEIQDVATIGSLWFAVRSFGVQLHDGDPAYRRGFGADPQPCELEKSQGLHQHCAMQMVLVLGATSKVNEQVQFAQQVVSKFLHKLSHCPNVWNLAHAHRPAPVGCARRHHLCVGRLCSGSCLSVHLFVIADDFWYASVLVHKPTRLSQVSCRNLGVVYAGMGA